jgi:hypothetical protein
MCVDTDCTHGPGCYHWHDINISGQRSLIGRSEYYWSWSGKMCSWCELSQGEYIGEQWRGTTYGVARVMMLISKYREMATETGARWTER